MSAMVNMFEAKTHLSRLVDRAAAGEEIIIAKSGKPFARLVPLEAVRKPREPGGGKGKIWLAPDWDDPMDEEMLDMFEGKDNPYF